MGVPASLSAASNTYPTGPTAKCRFEDYAALSSDIDIASEFRYRRQSMAGLNASLRR